MHQFSQLWTPSQCVHILNHDVHFRYTAISVINDGPWPPSHGAEYLLGSVMWSDLLPGHFLDTETHPTGVVPPWHQQSWLRLQDIPAPTWPMTPNPTQSDMGHPPQPESEMNLELVPCEETGTHIPEPETPQEPLCTYRCWVGGAQCGQVSFHEFWQGLNSVHKCSPT